MKTCEYDGAPFTEPRSHPWTDATASAAHRYYDLKADPARVRTSLEDFVPWSHHQAIDAFYTLLESLNARGSTLESNDCAFSGPHANEVASIAQTLQCSGRVMVLFRALEQNLSRDRVVALKNALHHRLQPLDPELAEGMIGTTMVPTRYVTLPRRAKAQVGSQLMISFWAWGSTEDELMANLGRVIANLSRGLLPLC